MDQEIQHFLSLLDLLEKRGSMYVQPFSYETVVAYVSGFDRGTTAAGGQSLLEGFPNWLHQRVGRHCAMHWSAVVKELCAKGESKAALPELFRLFREYLSELPVPASR